MITRRELLASLAVATRALAQAKPPIPVRALNHMTLNVSDAKRSLEFYQGLFGMPIQARQGTGVQLRIGPGPQFVALSAGSKKPGIDHLCMTTGGFNADRILKLLTDRGVKARVRMRDQTPELYLEDPDGIVVQIQDPAYCGGSGPLGGQCAATPEPAPAEGLLALRDLSHFTLSVSNPASSVAFYQELFGLRVQTHQGAAPVLGLGPGPQFVMAAPGAMPGIGHACFTMEGFDPDKVLKLLADFGIKPRGEARGPAGPLVSYVTRRMPDRGGAPGGTPELYFTDPDGILLQIQDVTYCGGSGPLGEVCQ